MRKYYLVEIDKNNNKYNIIRIADKLGLSLEEINQFTTKYSTLEELKARLFLENCINDPNSDLKIIYYDEGIILSHNIMLNEEAKENRFSFRRPGEKRLTASKDRKVLRKNRETLSKIPSRLKGYEKLNRNYLEEVNPDVAGWTLQ